MTDGRSVGGVRRLIAAVMVAAIGLVTASVPAGADAAPRRIEASSGVSLAGLIPVTPYRLLDTRLGVGVGGAAPIGQGTSIDVVVTGLGGVPAIGIDAVALNVTVTEPTQSSFLTVWPAGDQRPTASSLNMVGGQTAANLVIAKVGAGGAVSIFNATGSAHVVADVVGWSASTDFLHSFTPSRILDTRLGIGVPAGSVGADGTIELTVAGTDDVPATGVDSVILNVTVTEATQSSYVTVWPSGSPRPLASSLNMRAGETNPNAVISKVGIDGKVSLYNFAGSTHLVADIVGWLPVSGAYTAINPTRVLDTRDGTGTYGTFLASQFGPILRPRQLDFEQRIRPQEQIELQVAEPLDLPASATSVMLNLTGTEPTDGTYVTAWGSGTERPVASSLNLARNETRPNLVVAQIGADGYVSLYNNTGLVHLVADVVGYFEARNVQDGIDQVVGPQVHVVHVIASDGASTYDDEAIRHTLTVAESWLEDQGDRGIRFDTDQGVPEVSTLYIGKTKAELLAVADQYDNSFDRWVRDDGFAVRDKAYIFYVDGVATGGLCGLGGGSAAIVYTDSCNFAPASNRPKTTGTWANMTSAQVTVHELFHVLGAVASCAPTHDANGHVTDPQDVMYLSTNGTAPTRLDAGRDDYWGQGDSTCQGVPRPDLSLSPYLDAP